MAKVEVRYSVIVPVFNNEETLDKVIANLCDLSMRRGARLEVIFVIDGSRDRSESILEKHLVTAGFRSQLIVLSRNFGSFSAIRAGLEMVGGQFVAVMSADLQEPISAVDAFFDRLETGACDVVVGRRRDRFDPVLQTLAARFYWFAYRRFVNHEVPPGGVDVFGCTRAVAQVLCTFNETNTSLIGLLYWVGFRREEVDYVRAPRAVGRSGWTLRKKLRYLTDSLFAFTDRPIVAMEIVGVVGIFASIMIGAIVFVAWVLGFISDAGYTPLMLVIVASTSSLLLGLGIIGSYVWRAYENGKGRPLTLVMSSHAFGPESGEAAPKVEN